MVPLLARPSHSHQRTPRRHGHGLSRELYRIVREDPLDDAVVFRNRPPADQRQRDRTDARRHDRPHHRRYGPRLGLHLRRAAAIPPPGPRRQPHAVPDSDARGVHPLEPGQDGPQPRHKGRAARRHVGVHQPPRPAQRHVYGARRPTGPDAARPRPRRHVLGLVQGHGRIPRLRRGPDPVVADAGLRRSDDDSHPAGALRQPPCQRRDVHDLRRADPRPAGFGRRAGPRLRTRNPERLRRHRDRLPLFRDLDLRRTRHIPERSTKKTDQ